MIFKTKLLPHQIKAVAKLKKIKVGALYMEMGTGKTRTALELVNLALEKKRVEHVIWLCPCSVKVNLEKDLEKHCEGYEELISIYGIQTLSTSINAITKLLKLTSNTKCYLVVDESLLVKNHKALRTKHITQIAEQCKYKLILNGTPISRSEKDLYSQWYILDWRILGYRSFWSFAANHLEYDDKIPGKITETLNTDYLIRKISPYTYQIKKEECLGLPEKTFERVYYTMPSRQREHYCYIADKLLFNLDELEPWTIYKFLTGLQNVISGLRVDCSNDVMTSSLFYNNVKDNPRIECLLNILENIEQKVLIFCKYTHEIEAILKILGEKAVGFYGELSQKQREKNIRLFEQEKQFMVANKVCAGYGLNLQFCSYVIYYSNDWDYATRIQSEDRVHRIGQSRNVHYVDICCEASLDERILYSLEKKENLVTAFKGEIERTKDKKMVAELIAYGHDWKGRRFFKDVIKERVEILKSLEVQNENI